MGESHFPHKPIYQFGTLFGCEIFEISVDTTQVLLQSGIQSKTLNSDLIILLNGSQTLQRQPTLSRDSITSEPNGNVILQFMTKIEDE
jgi:hypothetical protein